MGLVTEEQTKDKKADSPQNDEVVNDDSDQLKQTNEAVELSGQQGSGELPANKGELIVDARSLIQTRAGLVF